MRLTILILALCILILMVGITTGSVQDTVTHQDHNSRDKIPVISVKGPYASQELIVRFTTPHDDAKITKRTEKLYGSRKNHTILTDYTPIGLPNTYRIQLEQGEEPKEASEKYKQDPETIFAEPNYEVSIDLVPNDPSFSRLWGLHNTGQTGGIADADIDAPEAWEISTGSRNVVVAVIDTGVDYTHPDLAANIWINTDEIAGNGIDDDGNGYIDDTRGWDFYNNDNNPADDHGHGTHCAGTIGAGGQNGIGVVGVNWQVTIMPLKFMSSGGSGYTSDAIEAILYANRNGADVLSNSWGGGGFSSSLKDAIDASPAVVVCAAGNDGKNTDLSPVYPASYTSPQIIAVAATTSYDKLASFSNYGVTSVDVGAPGEGIYSTLRGGSYGSMSGTSMATPHVAGLAALVQAQNPALSNLEIKEVILNSVDKPPALAGKVGSSGRINAHGALSSLQPVSLSLLSISPTSAPNNGPVTTTVTGTGFKEGVVVHLNNEGTHITSDVSVVSSSQLTCTFNIAGQPTGVYDLMVTNPDGESVQKEGAFTITLPPPPVPTISSISPTSAVMGGPAFVLTVTGTNFTKSSTGYWRESPRQTTFISEFQLRVNITASDIASAGTALVTVKNQDGSTSNSKTFTISSPLPAPTVRSISPTSGRVGTTKSLTIYGSNFVSGASAEFRKTGSEPIKCTNLAVASSGKITCRVSIPSSASTGYWDVAVINPDTKAGVKARAFRIY